MSNDADGIKLAPQDSLEIQDRLADLERRLAELTEALHLVGPGVFGLLRLLAYWSAQTGSLRISEDELLAQVRAVARDEWASALADRGLIPPLDPLDDSEIEGQ